MGMIKRNAADAESQKHSSLVLNLLVPALLLVKVACLSPLPTYDTVTGALRMSVTV